MPAEVWSAGQNAHDIAHRLRSLLGNKDGGDVATTARRLAVGERSLRLSVDLVTPRPAIEVLVAIIRFYGVDPSWLMTGDYDSATHRQSMESDDAENAAALTAIASRKTTPLGAPTILRGRADNNAPRPGTDSSQSVL